ncbi:MAG: energy transducer TonB [Pseudomonadota bacterium]
MKRFIISAAIATGFHIALMVLMPSLSNKNNKILSPEIKSVMVTISYRQPILKQTSFKPNKPKPQKAISFTPKKETSTILKTKNLAKPEKKLKQNKPVIHNQKEVIKKKSTPVKMVEKKPIKDVKKQNFKEQLATVESTTPQKKETIKQKEIHIEFAKPLYKENTLPVYPVIAQKRGYHGVVELMVLVSEKGKVSSLKIFKSSGYKSLDHQAVKTVKIWLFEPGKRNGSPQEMWVKIPVKFELN